MKTKPKSQYYDDAEFNILVMENSSMFSRAVTEQLWGAMELCLHVLYAAFKHQGNGDVFSC